MLSMCVLCVHLYRGRTGQGPAGWSPDACCTPSAPAWQHSGGCQHQPILCQSPTPHSTLPRSPTIQVSSISTSDQQLMIAHSFVFYTYIPYIHIHKKIIQTLNIISGKVRAPSYLSQITLYIYIHIFFYAPYRSPLSSYFPIRTISHTQLARVIVCIVILCELGLQMRKVMRLSHIMCKKCLLVSLSFSCNLLRTFYFRILLSWK